MTMDSSFQPGQLVPGSAPVVVNRGRPVITLSVRNTSRWTVQVSSHFHFFEVNRRLVFARVRAFGMRLDVPAGGRVRWAAGETREVRLVPFGGTREAWSFNGLCNGPTTPERLAAALARAQEHGFHSEAPDAV